jgi:hypothetical protein
MPETDRMQRRSSNTCGVRIGIACLLLCALIVSFPPARAQETEDRLDIHGIEHTEVDGQHVIIVRLLNSSNDGIIASGLLAVVDLGGLEVQRVNVDTGLLVPDGYSVMAVPLPEPLQPGRYTISLVLSAQPDGQPVSSGPRQINVLEPASSSATPGPNNQQATAERAFPSWLLLIAGVLLVGIGFAIRHGAVEARRRKPVPEVAMVRRVKVEARPARRPATIKPLRPPGRRSDEQQANQSAGNVRVGHDDL